MTLGEKIKVLRTDKKLTQQELADRCHMERRTLWGYENGKNTPTDIRVFRTLSEALGCSIYYLLESEEDVDVAYDYWTTVENFTELLKKLEHEEAIKLVSDVLSSYSRWLIEQSGTKDDKAQE